MSPESRTVPAPIPAPVSIRDNVERRDAPSTSWVAFWPRAKSISDCGDVVADDLVVAAAE